MIKYYIIMTCFAVLACGCQKSSAIIGHRGNSSYAPESTMAAVASCWEINADGTEVDVHLTKDKQIVVIHDKETKRTGGENHIIAESNYNDIKHRMQTIRSKLEKAGKQRELHRQGRKRMGFKTFRGRQTGCEPS